MKVLLLTWRLNKPPLHLLVTLLIFTGIFMLLPDLFHLPGYIIQIFSSAFLFASLAISWNILAAGNDISLGHAAFFGLGAYGSSLASIKLAINPVLCVGIGGIIAASFAVVLSVLFRRLKGAYFALGTLAAVEIPKVIIGNWDKVTRGSLGLINIRPLRLPFLHHDPRMTVYYVALFLLLLFVIASSTISGSRWGWALESIRQDEKAARTLGVNAEFYRIITMIVSGFFAGVCGALYAHSIGIIEPNMVFSIHFSALPMIMSIFGGRHSVLGPIIGSLLLFPMDQFLFHPIFPSGHQFLYGLVIMLTMLFMPGGVTGFLRGSRGHSSS